MLACDGNAAVSSRDSLCGTVVDDGSAARERIVWDVWSMGALRTAGLARGVLKGCFLWHVHKMCQVEKGCCDDEGSCPRCHKYN